MNAIITNPTGPTTSTRSTQNPKPVWQSRTFWTGVSEAIIGGVFQIAESVESGGASTAGIALMIVGAVTVILRLITEDPIGGK